MARTKDLTYDDLLEMFPEEEDGVRRELIEGELFVTPSPIPRHQRVVFRLARSLAAWTDANGGETFVSPLDVLLTEQDVVEPDVFVLLVSSSSRVEERFVRGAPDIVVEVSSPSTRELDLARKERLYERHGAKEFWFVDLEADRIEVRRLEAGRYGEPIVLGPDGDLTSPLLPGFFARVGDLLHAGAGPR